MSSKKQNDGTRKSLLSGVSIVAAAAAALTGTPAHAQDEDEAIVVTGSRIPQPNLVTTSPVTQLTADDITTQGVTRVEDMVNQLPQAFAAQNATVANGATGAATVDLRGLGPARTLVLIDGRRMPYGTPDDAAADINSIPGALIERVEVLTGGASAVYGSDAVSGVVNFIMRDDFEGIRLDAQYGFYHHNNDYDESTDGTPTLRDVIEARSATNPAQFQLPEDDVVDGYGKEATVIFGATSPDGRGNITAYLNYRTNDAILQRDRDFSACSLGTGAASGVAAWQCGGSGTSYPGYFGNSGGVYTVDSGSGNTFIDFDNDLHQYNFGPVNYFQRPDERYAFGAFGRYEINERLEVYSQAMFSNYQSVAQIAPSGAFFNTNRINCVENPLLSPQQQALVCDTDLVADIVDDPLTLGEDERQDAIDALVDAGLLLADATFLVDRTVGTQTCFSDDAVNALDTPGSADGLGVTDLYGDATACPLYIGRRNVEGGGRQDHLEYTSYRGVIGFRGDLSANWGYDVAASYSRTMLGQIYRNDFGVTRIQRALDVVDADPGPGIDPQCRSFVDGTDPNCVPYNIFTLEGATGGADGTIAGGVTQDALNYLQIPLLRQASMTQQVVTASLTGDTGIASPMAESTIAASFGIEYRRDAIDSESDTNFASGEGAGQGGPTTGLVGETDALDLFAETRIPLIEGAPLADMVSLDLAYRHSTYSTGVETDTYKIGGDWAPTEDLRLRGSFQRAVRAANVIELFSAQGFNLFDMDYDPCDAVNRPVEDGPVPAACIGTNPWQVSAGQSSSGALTSPAGQYNFLQGGNPDLQPEVSDTYTAGFVLTPSFLPGFNLSVDWFNIRIEDTVSVVLPGTSVANCFEEGVLSSCALITRNPGNGRLWTGAGVVSALNINIGALETTGVDLNANYRMDAGSFGGLTFNMVGTYLEELVTEQGPGLPTFDCQGSFAGPCGVPAPEWRHRFRVGWETPWDLELSGTWRYYGEVQLVDAGGNPINGRLDSTFEEQHYFDLAGNWSVADNANLRFGINNIFDDDPPISKSVGTTGNGNTYPQTYDALGRWIFAGVTVDF